MNNAREAATADLKSQLAQHLSSDLGKVNEILASHMKSSSDFVTDVTEHVSRFRGKQIRPIMLLLMHRMVATNPSSAAMSLAAAMEMIHTATLVHDDIIDGAKTRRHVATVHHRWSTETSVLLGDYLFSKAFHLTATTGDAEACRLIGLATDRTCEGELNQSAQRMNHDLTVLDYFRIIRDKTGQLFAVSCLLGTRSAGATAMQQQAARRFGFRLGYAFQIVDDLLDLTGDQPVTGKDESNDLQNGRLTLPVLRALSLANDTERQELLEFLGGRTQTPLDLKCHPAILRGIESASLIAAELSLRAVRDLQHFAESGDRALLEAIAAFTVERLH